MRNVGQSVDFYDLYMNQQISIHLLKKKSEVAGVATAYPPSVLTPMFTCISNPRILHFTFKNIICNKVKFSFYYYYQVFTITIYPYIVQKIQNKPLRCITKEFFYWRSFLNNCQLRADCRDQVACIYIKGYLLIGYIISLHKLESHRCKSKYQTFILQVPCSPLLTRVDEFVML